MGRRRKRKEVCLFHSLVCAKLLAIFPYFHLLQTKAAARMEEEASKGHLIIKVLAVVAGDFLAPSLLSCLDNGRGRCPECWADGRGPGLLSSMVSEGRRGRTEGRNHPHEIHSFLPPPLPTPGCSTLSRFVGMVDVLNACGVDYVCLGNHETDIPHRDMLERIVESDFVWVRGEGGGGVVTDWQGGGGSRGGKERRKRRREKGRILIASEERKEKSALFAASSTSLASSLLPQINSSIPSLPLLDVPLEPQKIPEYALLEVGGIEVALLGNAEGKDVSVWQRKIEGGKQVSGLRRIERGSRTEGGGVPATGSPKTTTSRP